jgi:hypothetical protein
MAIWDAICGYGPLSTQQKKQLCDIVLAACQGFQSQWMTQTWSVIQSRKLSQIAIPGAHDAGTGAGYDGTSSTIKYIGDASESNSRTQAVRILDQLMLGVRYFDLRPYYIPNISGITPSSSVQLYLCHGSNSTGNWSGLIGQSVSSALQDVVQFCDSLGSAHEVIILKFSHFAQLIQTTMAVASSMSQSQYTEVMNMVSQTLGGLLYTGAANVNLNSQTLSEIGEKGTRVVAVFDVGSTAKPQFPASLIDGSKGIFAYGDIVTDEGAPNTPAMTPNFIMYDCYANKDEAEDMVADQAAKLKEYTPSTTQSFLLSWTLTPQLGPMHLWNTLKSYISDYSISTLAQKANPTLGPDLLQWKKDGVITASRIPNVIYLDYVGQYADNAAWICADLNSWKLVQPAS